MNLTAVLLINKFLDRFVFYLNKSFFIFLLTKILLFSQNASNGINTTSSSLIAILPLFSYYIFEKYFSKKQSIFIGISFVLTGLFLNLFYTNQFLFFLSLGFFTFGYSIIVPNFNNLLSLIFPRNILISVFQLMHVVGNCGAFCGFMLAGILIKFSHDWLIIYLNFAASILMLFFYIFNYKKLPYEKNTFLFSQILPFILLLGLIFFISGAIFRFDLFLYWMKYVFLGILLFVIYKLWSEKNTKLNNTILLMISSLSFFMLMTQLMGIYFIFMYEYGYNSIFGYEINPVLLKALNPASLILLRLFFPSVKEDFAYKYYIFGLFLVNFVYLIWYFGCINLYQGKILAIYNIVVIILLSIAEYFVTPFLQAQMGMVKEHNSFLMSIFLVWTSFANICGLYSKNLISKENFTIIDYTNFFYYGFFANFIWFVFFSILLIYLHKKYRAF